MIIILAEKNGTIAMIQFHRIYLKCPDVNRIDYIEREKKQRITKYQIHFCSYKIVLQPETIPYVLGNRGSTTDNLHKAHNV